MDKPIPFLSLLLLAACASAPHPMDRNPLSESQMSETAIIELSEGARAVTLEDLERIKRALLQALRNKTPAEDYSHLITELEHQSAPMILPDGTARIGAWRLIVRNGKPLMERQQVPRAPVMLFYEAPLSIEDGRWVVADVGIKKVRGR